jgi:hypothetical protein
MAEAAGSTDFIDNSVAELREDDRMFSITNHCRQVSRFTARFLMPALFIAIISISGAAFGAIPPKGFSTPEDAVTALVSAAQNNDTRMLLAIFGPEARELISSGDPVADRIGRERFVARYREFSRIERRNADAALLIVGTGKHPYPIPLIKEGDVWVFDTRAGKEEIINRRIGRNELGAIEVLREYVEAQHEYADMNGRSGEFARKLVSSPDKHDGLYWEARQGGKESPFGPLVAAAAMEGYTVKKGTGSAPFRGYYYRILTGQGSHAPGGARKYVVEGKMTGGFAMVAYPAKYGSSGVMTFLVNHDGIVYEKNLGRNTGKTARSLSLFDPDDTWKKATSGYTSGRKVPAGNRK